MYSIKKGKKQHLLEILDTKIMIFTAKMQGLRRLIRKNRPTKSDTPIIGKLEAQEVTIQIAFFGVDKMIKCKICFDEYNSFQIICDTCNYEIKEGEKNANKIKRNY